MSLDKEKAVRKEKSPNRAWIYIFICGCGREIRCRGQYLKSHTGQCVGCAGTKQLKSMPNPKKLRPYEEDFNKLKARYPEVNFDYEEYLKYTKIDRCYYCGSKINWEAYTNNRPGNLDRVKNELGHIEGNLVVCCSICNRMKGDMSLNDFLEKIEAIYEIGLGGSCGS